MRVAAIAVLSTGIGENEYIGDNIRGLIIENHWFKQLADKDVAIIGVHTPETPGETRAANVRAAIRHDGIAYPVLIDADHKNWDRWHQQFWPTIYLIDKHGRIRYRWEGELEYNGQNGTAKVAQLIAELQNEK